VATLRKTLYILAALWAVCGVACAVAPEWVLHTIARLPLYTEYAWVRVAGAEAVALAMLMVLVGNRVRDVWAWSWAFVLVNIALTVFALVKAALGLGSSHGAFWWIFGAICAVEAVALMIGMLQAVREQPV
jgi:hypothetical protein